MVDQGTAAPIVTSPHNVDVFPDEGVKLRRCEIETRCRRIAASNEADV
jgi:hypothetical protein